jgi:multiple antibiotic resistance protein
MISHFIQKLEFCLDYISALVKAVIALFIIVDPFGNIPIFVGLTENMTDDYRKKVYNTAIIVGLILLLVFSFTGTEILQLFGISLESFEVAGGILLLIISIRILISGTREKVESPESVGAVPIAMPLLVGPGAITTTIITLQTYQNIQPNGAAISISIAVLAAVIVLGLTWVILRYTNGLYKFLGKTGAMVIARVMALLISAIAIQYILDGVSHFMFTTHVLLGLI